MKSAQTMFAQVLIAFTLSVILIVSAGCQLQPKPENMQAPGVIVSPYDTQNGDVLWAVIPPVNESGTSVVDELQVGDAIVAEIQGIRGVRCLPLNRSIAAMRELGFRNGIQSSSDAYQVAQYLGADAIVSASVTAYDPYDPPIFGLALALYSQSGSMLNISSAKLDTRSLSMAYSDFGSFENMNFAGEPVSVISEHLDARNHEVLMSVISYAQGRSDPHSALAWRVHTASMELYTRFGAHHCVGRLIDQEWLRLSRLQRDRRRP